MENCANCQAELDPDWKFCIRCGAPTPISAHSRSLQDAPAMVEAEPADDTVAPEDRAAAQEDGDLAVIGDTIVHDDAVSEPQPAVVAHQLVPAREVAATASAPQRVSAPARIRAEQIPAAIRDDEAPPPARKVNVPLIVSICLGAAGVILIAYLVILVFGARV